jgi:hypothetical protein
MAPILPPLPIRVPEFLLAQGFAAPYEVLDVSNLPKDKAVMRSLVQKFTLLATNLTKLMSSIFKFYRSAEYKPAISRDVIELTVRLTWVMRYWYGGSSHFSMWLLKQTAVKSVAQERAKLWVTFETSRERLWLVLALLPNNWHVEADRILEDSPQRQQIIPSEAPLELAAQIYLLVRDAVNPLQDPGKITPFRSLSKTSAECTELI